MAVDKEERRENSGGRQTQRWHRGRGWLTTMGRERPATMRMGEEEGGDTGQRLGPVEMVAALDGEAMGFGSRNGGVGQLNRGRRQRWASQEGDRQ